MTLAIWTGAKMLWYGKWSITKLIKKQLGGMLYLSLKGKAREYVRGINENDICSDTGFDCILAKLDEIYMKETDTRAFLAAEDFISYQRESGGDIRDFMIHYDYL